MKYLGIDYGAKRIGLAVSNAEGTIAFPRETIVNTGDVVEVLNTCIEKEQVAVVVVGDTRAANGKANTVTEAVEQFIDALVSRTGLPVERGWEAGSSIEASRYNPDSKDHDDSVAAAIILQRYLDTKGNLKNPSE